jgi:GNAT superfamily N-acetyltransferase
MVEYAAEPGTATCELAVVVGESWRRQGLALRLMEDLRDIAIANGFVQIAIDVLRDNLPALELARRFGARRPEGTRPSGGSVNTGVVRLIASLHGPVSHSIAFGGGVGSDAVAIREPSWKSAASTSRTYS